MNMKAAYFYGPDDMRIESTTIPECPKGGALLKLSGSLICGTDSKIYKNGHPKITPPHIIGHECCGVITELDDLSYGFKIGDRVTVQTTVPCGRCIWCQRGLFNHCESVEAISWNYDGAFAEYLAIPGKAMVNMIKAPANLSDREVCLAEPLACVINGQELLSIVPGENVLVIGAGPIGMLHAELAKLSGAGKVIISEASQDRIERAKGFGYDCYIDVLKENLAQSVIKETNGMGADVIIVTAPSKAAHEQAIAVAAPRGRISLFASLPVGKSDITIDSRPIHYKELIIVGASMSTAYQLRKALEVLSTGRLRTDLLITHTLELDDIVKGLEMSLSGEALKVYIKY